MIKTIYRIFIIALLLSNFACSDDFLEKYPEDVLTDEVFFTEEVHLKDYVAQLYAKSRKRYDGNGYWINADVGSDIWIQGQGLASSLYTTTKSSVADLTQKDWNNGYTAVRKCNYFLNNYHRVTNITPNVEHYIGEGYFFRAEAYFGLLKNFGGVPLITDVLNVSSEELYKERSTREEIAKFIIQDLDSAIHYLHLKNKGACKPGRVNKQAALTMKARVALYEGSWEYYHGRKGSDYAVAGKDGEAFLQDVVEAVDDLIEIEGTNIFTDGGIYDEPYNQLSAQNDMSKVAGVFYYTVYSQELLNKSHNMYEAITGDGFCYTRRFVDMYLDKDGKPRELSAHPLTTLNEMSENLEPRFKQTIYTPNRGPIVEMPGRRSGDFLYPQIQTTGYYAGATGFRNWKGAIFDESQYRDGETDHIHIRYAEGLLAYAEAKAILGTITQGDIDKTVNLLRSRIGATPMLLSEVNGWDIDYSENKGFDNTAANIVNEIRRERCIELAAEGFRGDDIKRWALLSEAYNGWRPEGANAAEFFDYFNDPDNRPDGYTEAEWLSNALEDGNNCKVLPNGNFNALWKLPYFEDGAEGCQVVEGRDYLKAVPFNEIELYKQKAGVILTQNPGWN